MRTEVDQGGGKPARLEDWAFQGGGTCSRVWCAWCAGVRGVVWDTDVSRRYALCVCGLELAPPPLGVSEPEPTGLRQLGHAVRHGWVGSEQRPLQSQHTMDNITNRFEGVSAAPSVPRTTQGGSGGAGLFGVCVVCVLVWKGHVTGRGVLV